MRSKIDEKLIKKYKVNKGSGLPTDCIYFNWSTKVKETCSILFDKKDILQKCVKLNGEKCKDCINGL